MIVILKRQESFKKLSELLKAGNRLDTADVTTAAVDTSDSTLRYGDVNVDKLSQPSAVDVIFFTKRPSNAGIILLFPQRM